MEKFIILLFIELTEKDLYAVVSNDWIFYGENPIIYVKKEHLTIENGIMELGGNIKISYADLCSLVDQEIIASQIIGDGYIIANWDNQFTTVSSSADCCNSYEYQKLSKFNIKKNNKKEKNIDNKELTQLKRRVRIIENLLKLDKGQEDYKTEKYYLEKQTKERENK